MEESFPVQCNKRLGGNFGEKFQLTKSTGAARHGRFTSVMPPDPSIRVPGLEAIWAVGLELAAVGKRVGAEPVDITEAYRAVGRIVAQTGVVAGAGALGLAAIPID